MIHSCLAQTPRCVTAKFNSKIREARTTPQIVGAKDEKAKCRRETGEWGSAPKDITIITERNSQCGTRHPWNALATCVVFNSILSQGLGPDCWLHYLLYELAGLIDPLRPLDNDTRRNYERDFRMTFPKVNELSKDEIIAYQQIRANNSNNC